MAPPPLTTEGRTQIANGGNITTAHNGSQVLVFDNADTQVAVESGAEPWVAVFNVPSWVKGTAPSDCTTKDVPIDYDYYTCTVTGSGFSGATRLVKQGEGTLVLPDVEMTHRGNTDVWNGTLVFNGTMKQSSFGLTVIRRSVPPVLSVASRRTIMPRSIRAVTDRSAPLRRTPRRWVSVRAWSLI